MQLIKVKVFTDFYSFQSGSVRLNEDLHVQFNI